MPGTQASGVSGRSRNERVVTKRDRTEAEASRARGRPRNPRINDAVLDATREQLGAHGYHRMTVESIARAAGVTKPTIYRRWTGKDDLVTASIAALKIQEPLPLTDDTRADLLANLLRFREALERPDGMPMVGTLLQEQRHNPELFDLFRDRIVRPRRKRIRQVLEHGVALGHVSSEADLDAAVEMMVGAYYSKYLSTGHVPKNWEARVVDAVLEGIAPR